MIEMELRIGGLESVDVHFALQRPHGVRAAGGRHSRVAHDDVRRTFAAQAAGAVGRAVGIRDHEVHVVEFESSAGGDANRAVQGQRHLLQRDLAFDAQFAVVAEFAGASEDYAIVKRQEVAVRPSRLREDRAEGAKAYEIIS